MYARHITQAVETALTDTPVVLLVGPRQAGKSTLAQGLVGAKGEYFERQFDTNLPAFRRYITLDDPVALAAARQDPVSFVAGLDQPVVIDEVQRAPERIVGIEVKATRTLSGREFAGLRHFAEKVGDRFVRGIVLYGGTEGFSFDANLYALPVQSLWAPWSVSSL